MWSIDRFDASSSCCDDHPRSGRMPYVAGILRSGSDVAEPHSLAGGEVTNPEHECFDSGTAAGDLLHPSQRPDIFDQHFETDESGFQPMFALQLGDQVVYEPHFAWSVDLGDDDHIGGNDRVADDCDQVVVAPRSLDSVDPHGATLVRPRKVAQGRHSVRSGLILGPWCNCVLEVDHDDVSGGCCCLGEHGWVGAGCCQLGAAQAWKVVHVHVTRLRTGRVWHRWARATSCAGGGIRRSRRGRCRCRSPIPCAKSTNTFIGRVLVGFAGGRVDGQRRRRPGWWRGGAG